MKKIILSLLCITLLFSGCSGYSQEEVDSMVSEATSSASSESYDAGYEAGKEAGKESGYEEGFDAGIEAFQESPGEYAPSGWYCVPVDLEEQYWDTMNYYSRLCEHYGLPEYYEGWNEEDWETEEYVTDNSVSSNSVEEPQEAIVYWTPNGGSYHSTEYCRTLSRSKNILSGTIDEAIASGHGDPCNVCN